jgi:hypothetical protein
MTYYNSYWNKAQQQKPQAKQTQPKQRQQGRQRDGFDDEWKDRDVEVEHVKEQGVVAMRGRVVDVSKYWLKIIVNGEVVYINKAYVVSIKPLEMKDIQGGGNAGGQSSRQK